MRESVLLDTSFFIRLLKEDDPLHQNSMDYFRYFLENEYTLRISTIAVAEFCTKGDLEDLPIRNLLILPFNLNHAVNAGRLGGIAFRIKNQRQARITPRTVIPNDTKMFAQADVEEDIHFFASADAEAYKVYQLIESETNLRFRYLDISTPYNQIFGVLPL